MSSDPISRVVFRALHSRKASEEETAGFRDLGHNEDLCPQLKLRLDDLLASCKRNFNVVYDVQGVRDYGVDVVIRISSGDEGEYIAFQIKADYELTPSSLLLTLKGQHFDASNRYDKKLVHYYIVPCADLTMKGRRDRVRLIAAEFATTVNLTVLDPQYLWNFLYSVKVVEEQALVTAYVNDEDPLVVEASHLANVLTVVQLRTLLAIIAHLVTKPDETLLRRDLLGNRHISDAVNLVQMLSDFGLPLDFIIPTEYQFDATDAGVPTEDDFDALNEWVELDESDRVTFIGWAEQALISLAYEASARYSLEGPLLAEYLETLLSTRYDPIPFEFEQFEYLTNMVFDISELQSSEPSKILARILELNWSQPDDVIALVDVDVYDEQSAVRRSRILDPVEMRRSDSEDYVLTWEDLANDLLDA